MVEAKIKRIGIWSLMGLFLSLVIIGCKPKKENFKENQVFESESYDDLGDEGSEKEE